MYEFIWATGVDQCAAGLVNLSNSTVKSIYNEHDIAQQDKYNDAHPEEVAESNYAYGGFGMASWETEWGMDEEVWKVYKERFASSPGQFNSGVRGIVFNDTILVKQNVMPQATEGKTANEAFGGGPLGNSFDRLINAWCNDSSIKGNTPKYFIDLLTDGNNIINGELSPDEYPIKPEYQLTSAEEKVCKDYLNFFVELDSVNWSKGLKANGEEFMQKYNVDFILI